jgi:orc1/cdc6 family replication initiation protein
MTEARPIIINPEILNETYILVNAAAREAHLEELLHCLKPGFDKKKPMHAWLFGEPGTGKTLLVKHILGKMSKEALVGGIYINCWEQNSFYSVLDKLVRELRMLGAEKLNASFKLERLKMFIGSKPFIIVLDEIDKPKREERDSILYNLCNIGNVGLVCVSNSRSVLYSMDDRIKSRLNARQIEFHPYAQDDLLCILKQRAELAFSPGSWNEVTLRKVAELAEGDARVAIQTLKNAAYNAEKDAGKTINENHIKDGFTSAKGMKKAYLLDKLTSHHRLLYEIVKARHEINSGALWDAYLARCRAENKPAIALRTFSEYMNRLIELDLVRWDRALVRGKVRVFTMPS